MIDTQTGAVFAGASPTKPWTDVCLAQRTGQRISGPLFFGFSDPLTQRAIAANLYSEEELRAALHVRQGAVSLRLRLLWAACTCTCLPLLTCTAPALSMPCPPTGAPTTAMSRSPWPVCLQGGKVEQAAAAPEELAAREFCGVEGVGEATAIALAHSTALGGSRHAGLDSLRSWASASGALPGISPC